ncbi:hypothetical protein OTU49_011893, partial [Cherax quadricarinatus]
CRSKLVMAPVTRSKKVVPRHEYYLRSRCMGCRKEREDVVLYVNPSFSRDEPPCVKGLPTVTLDFHQQVTATINGFNVTLTVDCGTSLTLMTHTMARRIHLTDSITKYINLFLATSKCEKICKVGVVPEVHVCFPSNICIV